MQQTKVDKTLCIGCALCVATCPNSYKLEEDMISVALPTQLDDKALLDMSIVDCPVGAIDTVDNTSE